MATAPLPTISELRQLVRFDPETGLLYWRPRESDTGEGMGRAVVWNRRYAGKEAITSVSYGYRYGWIMRKSVLAHRVIWALAYGEWPDCIDHIDGNRLNNRLDNLRSVPAQVNCQNMARNRRNKSGVTGVRFEERVGQSPRWYAYITENGKLRSLGRFQDFDDAVAARKSAERKLGYHANHGARAAQNYRGGAL